GKMFASPEAAVRELDTAVNHKDTAALNEIFGPAIAELKAPDPVEAQNELADFTARFNASNHISKVAGNRCILEIGEDRWPFAIPLVRAGESWFFDTEAGKEEIIKRRVGNNELQALKAIRAGAEAQREYASQDRDGSEVLKYAQKLISSPGAKNGLYWSP